MSTGDTVFGTREQFLDMRVRNMASVLAPEEQRPDLKALADALAAAHAEGRYDAYQLVDSLGDKVPVPETAVFILKRVAEVLARGDYVSTVLTGREISTQQAANVLNVSQEYMVRLLDEGSIPCTKNGEHRRVHVEDVLAYKYKRDRKREAGLAELTRLSQEYGGYEELE